MKIGYFHFLPLSKRCSTISRFPSLNGVNRAFRSWHCKGRYPHIQNHSVSCKSGAARPDKCLTTRGRVFVGLGDSMIQTTEVNYSPLDTRLQPFRMPCGCGGLGEVAHYSALGLSSLKTSAQTEWPLFSWADNYDPSGGRAIIMAPSSFGRDLEPTRQARRPFRSTLCGVELDPSILNQAQQAQDSTPESAEVLRALRSAD